MKSTSQKGAVAPLVAILLFVILVCVALVVDLGHTHNVKIQLQRAVDAAALAAAKELPVVTDVKAVAIAVAAANLADQQDIIITNEDIKTGLWNESIVNPATGAVLTTLERFTESEDDPNAVYVKATLPVDPVFFFFMDPKPVTADAIALAKPTYPILPLAVVSCIPTNDEPGSLPDMTICGVVGHQFSEDPTDLAAWSSLTLGTASATDILDILGDDSNFDLFNQIVFGRGLETTDGIENDPVDTARPTSFNYDRNYDGCDNDGTAIHCGLGGINDKDIAPRSDFVAPVGIPDLITDGTGSYYTGSLAFDPLADYPILPRWYNVNYNAATGVGTGFDSGDHFIRVISQDGILLKGPGETDAQHQQRLNNLKNGIVESPYGADDTRFISPTANDKNNFIDKDDKPNYLAVARYAGYPKVHVMNGVTTTVMETFLKRLYGVDDKKDIVDPLPCGDNEPFPENQKSVRLNVPVIFAGNCDDWKAVDASDFVYIGMAKFLMTRAMLTNTMYSCAGTERGNAGSCTETFTPPLDGLGEFGPVTFNAPAMVEGLYTLPTTDDDDEEGGRVDVFLVE
ncbi:MAG: hypothetical protein C0614_06575 [Desulfuromonas sp.]|nr:MAG: hypothetical protein C0614_06575 [Desulfuromonas sp.]